jgi:hypothetical protein
MLECVLDRDRSRGPVRDNLTFVDTAGEFVQAHTVASKFLLKHRLVQASQFAHSLYSEFRQLLFGGFSDSGQPPNRKGHQKRICFLRLDPEKSVRLPPVRGQHCQELVGSHARRGREI